MTVLLITMLAHVLGDFIFQTDEIAKEKSDMVKIAFLKHGFFIFITLFVLLLLGYQLKVVLVYSLIIAILHMGIDYLICSIQNRYSQFQEWILFLVDQAVHLLIIFIAWNFLKFSENNYINDFCSWLFQSKATLVFSQINSNAYSKGMEIVIINKILIYLIVYLFFSIGSGYFISKLLKSTTNSIDLSNDTQGLKKAGNMIGILERMLIITLVINNSISAIGFVIAAKSIARYDKITTKKEFSEYYLIGTFSSVLIGIIGGYTLIGMLRIFI